MNQRNEEVKKDVLEELLSGHISAGHLHEAEKILQLLKRTFTAEERGDILHKLKKEEWFQPAREVALGLPEPEKTKELELISAMEEVKKLR